MVSRAKIHPTITNTTVGAMAKNGETLRDVFRVRRENFKALVKKLRSTTAMANKLDSTPGYISQLISPKNPRNIGENVARKIETAMKLPRGWMDAEHAKGWDGEADTTNGGKAQDLRAAIDTDRLVTIVTLLNEVIGELQADVSPGQHARIVGMLYMEDSEPTRAKVRALVQLAGGAD